MAYQKLQGRLPAVAASAGTTLPCIVGEVPVNESEQHWLLGRASIAAPSAVTGNDTNSGTLNLRQYRAGAALGTIASLALVSGVNLVANQSAALTISGTPDLVAGDLLVLQYVQIGTGLALPVESRLEVELQ